MRIEAPFTVGIVDNEDTATRELHIAFKENFRAESPQQRGEIFSRYVDSLDKDIEALEDDDPDRIGMMTIQQISRELLPHIIADEIALLDTIVVEIAQDSLVSNLLKGVPIQ